MIRPTRAKYAEELCKPRPMDVYLRQWLVETMPELVDQIIHIMGGQHARR